MARSKPTSQFRARLLLPAVPHGDSLCAFIVLPKDASAKLARRGRVTVALTINEHEFHATLEPDGKLSHWLPISKKLLKALSATVGETVAVEVAPVQQEPEPEVPSDLRKALVASPEARAVWDDTTTVARVDWIHWITSAKQDKTRAKRINDACDMLASGKRRVCCFDPSGYYSKALSAPKVAEGNA